MGFRRESLHWGFALKVLILLSISNDDPFKGFTTGYFRGFPREFYLAGFLYQVADVDLLAHLILNSHLGSLSRDVCGRCLEVPLRSSESSSIRIPIQMIKHLGFDTM